MRFYLWREGKEVGPFNWVEIFVMLRKEQIDEQTSVRVDGEIKCKTVEAMRLWGEGEEAGPFTWNEVLFMLKEGCFDEQVRARIEGDFELKTLEEVIKNSSEAPVSLKQEARKSNRLLPNISPSIFLNRLRTAPYLLAGVIFLFFLIGVVGWIFRDFPAAVKPDMSVNETVSEIPSVASAHSSSDAAKPSMIAPAPTGEIRDTLLVTAVPSHEVPDLQVPQKTPDTPATLLPEAPSSTPEAVAQTSEREKASLPPDSSASSIASKSAQTPSIKVVEAISPPPASIKNPFEASPLAESELCDILAERFSAPKIRVTESYGEKPDPRIKIYEGSFVLDTPLKWNPKVEVVYRLPMRSKNHPGPDADNVLMMGFYFSIIQPRKTLTVDGQKIQEKSKLHAPLTYFSDKLGYTAFSLHILTNPEILADPKEAYNQAGPEWVDLVFRAQEEIVRRHNLKPRKLLLYGSSFGGEFVQKIAAASPEKVAAIAIQSAPGINIPKTASDTAWFLSISRGDSMRGEYERLYKALAEQKSNLVFSVFPPSYNGRGVAKNFYHSQSAIANAASRAYLRGVVESYDRKGNINPTRWPYVRDKTKPLRIYRTVSQQGRAIPVENREFLPSESFARCLQSIPAPIQTLNLKTSNQKILKCYVGLPALGKPKGVLLYSQLFNYMELAKLFDNINYLAERGYVVIAPQLAKNGESGIQNALAFINRTSILKEFPLVCLGTNERANCLWDVLAKDRAVACKAISLLEFDPKESLDESKLPPGYGVKFPTLFVYDELPITEVGTSEEAKKSLQKISTVKSFIEKCKARHQMAQVAFIPKARVSEIQAAQKSLETADTFFTQVIENRISEIKPQITK